MAYLVRITGVVQGVGFRPHIYRRANRAGFSGWVLNAPGGVSIYLEHDRDCVEAVVEELLRDLPSSARVDGVDLEEVASQGVRGFTIAESIHSGAATAEISRDLAVCERCLSEMRDPRDRRYGYPYISCTNCGPRFSIVTALPYDRANTTMARWELCEHCAREYRDPLDRRFHAEPIACWECGPTYRLYAADSKGAFYAVQGDSRVAVEEASAYLQAGKIVAVKGVGGYHFACDATNTEAVHALREAKFRKDKPFAVMVKDLSSAESTGELSPYSRDVLTSSAAPIVLVPSRINLDAIAPGSTQIGVMLAYTPLHHLLFDAGAPSVLIMTSGNRSSEPISFSDSEALERFRGIAEAVLVGERPIARRLDDSVVYARPYAGVLRRSRGLAPSFCAGVPWLENVVGCGADLKATVTLTVGGRALVSQYLGDLDYYEVRMAHRESIVGLMEMYQIDAGSVTLCTDLHPGYSSRVLAEEYAKEFGTGEPLLVQHHRAHIASVAAEHGMWNETVLGVALDGTGYGDDGTIWGGEFFEGSVLEGFVRIGSIGRARLLGGDGAARRPLQALCGYLEDDSYWTLMSREIFGVSGEVFGSLSTLRSGVGSAVDTTSAGRLFDSMAAICGFIGSMTYEGQAAMWLENQARSSRLFLAGASAWDDSGAYRFGGLEGDRIDFQRVLINAIEDRLDGVDVGTIALRFHLGFAFAIAAVASRMAVERSIATVILSGGVFQNRIVTDVVSDALRGRGHVVKMNNAVSCNDEGISLGQVAIGGAMRYRDQVVTGGARQ
ncbi:MAG: carbamoyltransferase HypF [Ferrimicrobium sp.]